MKTFDRKDIYTIANAKEAQKYVGRDGYFSDSYEGMLKQVSTFKATILQWVDEYKEYPFMDCVSDDLKIKTSWRYFLPEEKVKNDHKRYRQIYTYKEFIVATGADLGKVVSIRLKSDRQIVTHGILTSIVESLDKMVGVSIGGTIYTNYDLFKKYEFYNVNSSEWVPFGTEVV